MTTTGRYATELAGRAIEVEAAGSGLTSTARLYVDAEQVDEQSKSLEEITLSYEDVEVRVMCLWPGRISRCVLVLRDEPAGDDDKPAEHRVPLDPPPGTHAAKLIEFQRTHPRLYAARHVGIAAGQVVAVILGLGVLVRGLLPTIDMSWLPDMDLSWIPDPLGWMWGLLPDISMPGWWDTLTGSSRYWLPILIALVVAANEVEKRRKARNAKAERDQS